MFELGFYTALGMIIISFVFLLGVVVGYEIKNMETELKPKRSKRRLTKRKKSLWEMWFE